MVSIKEQMQAFEAKISANELELKAIHTACDDYKTENEAVKADLEGVKIALESAVADKVKVEETLKAELVAKEESLKQAQAVIEDMKAKMELAPIAEAQSAGREPIAEGIAAEGKVDYIAEMNKLEGAEKIAFYRANSKEIDEAFKVR